MQRFLKYLLVVLLSLQGAGIVYGQKQGRALIDSLLQRLPKANNDTDKVNILTGLSGTYPVANTADAIKCATKAIDLAEKINWEKGILNAYFSQGVNYESIHDLPAALKYYNAAKSKAETVGDKKNIARSLYSIGDVNAAQKNYTVALQNYQQSLKIYQELKDTLFIAQTLGNIGIFYGRQDSQALAVSYDLSAAIYYVRTGNKAEMARIYGNIAVDYQNQFNYPSAMDYDVKALNLYTELKNKDGEARILSNMGVIYQNEDDFDKALSLSLRSLKIYEVLDQKDDLSRVLINIATAYNSKSNYPGALEYFFKALNLNEDVGNKDGIATASNQIGWVYFFQNNFSKAMEYHFKALAIYEELKSKPGIAGCYSGIGTAYGGQEDFSKAIEYQTKSLLIYEELGSKTGISNAYINLGDEYFKDKNYAKALACDFKVLRLSKEIGDKSGNAISMGNIGESYLGIAKDTTGKIQADSLISKNKNINLQKAIEYLNKGLAACFETKNLNAIMENSGYLSEAYAISGNYKEALRFHIQYTTYKDSLFSTDNNLKTNSIELGQDMVLKNKDLEIKNKQIQLDKLEVQKKRNERSIFIAGVVLLLLVIFYMLRNHNIQKRTNRLLALEKDKSEKFLKDIKIKNKAITDNIDYAQRIQSAILPDIQLIYKALEQSFILYLPKDIVSGDFYAFAEQNDHVLIIAGDCTGHGVSGAFMSMIGSSLLNQIINERGTEEPALILNQLNKSVIEALKQGENQSASADGMDISICSFDMVKNELLYAGANRPLWLIRNNELKVYQPDKFPIGGLQMARDRVFTSHTIALHKNDTVYIFTDGYADQFGGAYGKKLMTAKFKEMLLSMQGMGMREQEGYLKKYFEEWKGNNEQVDDVLVIGVRV